MLGTSERLADKMALAVEEKISPTRIEKIALRGEGMVNTRVDLLYEQVMHGPTEVWDKKKKRAKRGKPVVPAKEFGEEMMSSSSSASSTTGTQFDESIEEEETVADNEPREIEVEKISNAETSNRKKISTADAIIIAAHSQGVPVTVMLIARLIQEGVIDMEKSRVCIIGMAVCVMHLIE
jgi:hypothetical protein